MNKKILLTVSLNYKITSLSRFQILRRLPENTGTRNQRGVQEPSQCAGIWMWAKGCQLNLTASTTPQVVQ